MPKIELRHSYSNERIFFIYFTGDNRIIIVVGANNSLSSRDVEEAENLIEAAKVILFQFETRLEPTIRALELCSKYSC